MVPASAAAAVPVMSFLSMIRFLGVWRIYDSGGLQPANPGSRNGDVIRQPNEIPGRIWKNFWRFPKRGVLNHE
ncbi:MAG TPA: hypothetical protein DCX79_20320, partial [Planctomycetaceae bacterium]|nr:hypothetical protein [Planctomycetaceae bacterium]